MFVPPQHRLPLQALSCHRLCFTSYLQSKGQTVFVGCHHNCTMSHNDETATWAPVGATNAVGDYLKIPVPPGAEGGVDVGTFPRLDRNQHQWKH